MKITKLDDGTYMIVTKENYTLPDGTVESRSSVTVVALDELKKEAEKISDRLEVINKLTSAIEALE